MGRMEHTVGPENGPQGLVIIFVLYMGTLRPIAIWRTSMPARISASSNEKLHPIRKPTVPL